MRLILGLITTSLVALVLATGAGAATVVNGDFETGDFTGWTTWNTGGFGEWFVYAGTVSPISNNQIAAPPQGTYAATTDQIGEGTHILYKDVALEPGQPKQLHRALHRPGQGGEGHRLDEVAERPVLDGLHGALDRGAARHEHHGNV